MEDFNKVIYEYTREQAIKDGVLVDISNKAKEYGYTIPIAVTYLVWDKYIEWTEQDSDRQTSQDQTGRLHDILWMLRLAIRGNRNTDQLLFKLSIVPRSANSKRETAVTVQLKAVIGASSPCDSKPAITIMLPDED